MEVPPTSASIEGLSGDRTQFCAWVRRAIETAGEEGEEVWSGQMPIKHCFSPQTTPENVGGKGKYMKSLVTQVTHTNNPDITSVHFASFSSIARSPTSNFLTSFDHSPFCSTTPFLLLSIKFIDTLSSPSSPTLVLRPVLQFTPNLLLARKRPNPIPNPIHRRRQKRRQILKIRSIRRARVASRGHNTLSALEAGC